MSKSARSRLWTRWISRKPAPELPPRALRFEQLEDRLAPATFTWTGGSTGVGANANWSTAGNWQGGIAPSTGVIDLVFPSGAARPANFNDLATGTVINSITIQGLGAGGVGYNISQAPDPAINSIVLGNGSPSSGNFTVQAGVTQATFSLPTTLATNGDQSISVGSGANLTITAAVNGSVLNNLNKDGVGRLTLSASNPNLLGGVKVNNGILEIKHVLSLGPVNGTETVVSTNAGLYLNNVATVTGGQQTIGENVRLNGGGFNVVEGALYQEAGNSIWSGSVILETGITSPPQAGGPGTVIGANTGSVLNITGIVSDSGAGMGLVKEGAGEVRLGSTTGNTYRGQTNVNNGILTATHALSLGDSRPTFIVNGFPSNDPRARPQPGNFGTVNGAFQSVASGTVVNQTPGRRGQLRLEAPTGTAGFTVVGEVLVLNSNGNDGNGAVYNTYGDNIWAGAVSLGSTAPDGAAPSIGVLAPTPATTVPPITPAAPSSLNISGVVSDLNLPNTILTKVGGGRLILSNNNTYRGLTDIRAGTITIRDSQGLGPAGGTGGTTVRVGATLELDVEAAYAGTAVPQYDDLGRDTYADSITNDAQALRVNETLTLNGRGVGATGVGVTTLQSNNGFGALRSMTGINRWLGTVTLVASGTSAEAAIGVEPDGALKADGSVNTGVNGIPLNRAGHPTPDSSYFTADYSLTVDGTVSGGRGVDFAKRGAGHLILPNANPYFGRTLIEEGWVTIQNNRSLGDVVPNTSFGKTAQQPTIVSNGASLHLRPPTPGNQLLIQEDYIVLEGIGPTHPYSFISQKGALVNLGGSNTVTGDVGLLNTFPGTPSVSNPPQGAGIGVEDVVPDPSGTNPSDLTITGDVADGIRYQQSQSGFFTAINQTAVFQYNAGSVSGRIAVPYSFGAIPDRLQIYYPDASSAANLIFDTGGFVTGVGLATVNFGPGGSTMLTVIVTSGGGTPTNLNFWDIGIQTIDATPRGIITTSPGSLVKLGSRTLNLQGAGSYTGTRNEVREGTLRAQNDTALGRATTGTEITQQSYPVTTTEVASAAKLELAGSVAMHEGGVAAGVNILDERLVLNQYGIMLRIAGQDTARFQLNFAGQLSRQIPAPSGYTAAFGYNPTTLPYDQFLQQVFNQDLPNIAGNLVLGVNPPAAPPLAVVTQVGPGVYTVTYAGPRFNNFDFNALTVNVLPVGTQLIPTVGVPAQTVAAIAEVRISGSNAPLLNLSDDNGWRGPVTLNSGTRIEVRPNSRLLLLGDIRDNTNPDPLGSDLVKRDAGDLTLGGAASDYRGNTYIDEGIVTAVSSRSFGATLGGTLIADGAQLQLQGSLTIAGESLQVQGNGSPTLPSLDSTIRWLNVGPGATNNGVAASPTTTGAPTSARVNSVATDPTDPRTIYVATAGGGAWKTKDGGLTWIALFDIGLQNGTNTPLAAATDAAGTTGLPLTAMMFGGQIAVAPTNPSIIYYATGDSNGQFNGLPNLGQTDNYAGSGVYRSVDSGKTWTLLTNGLVNPIYAQAVTKLIVDPFVADRIYVATSTLRLPNPGTAGSPATILNVSLNASPTAPTAGVWRWTIPRVTVPQAVSPLPPIEPGGWVNLTTTPSPRRGPGGAIGQAPFDAAPNGYGTVGNVPGIPNAAGPEDDYRIRFPAGTANTAEAATWSDIALVVRTTAHPLYGSVDTRPFPPLLTGPAYTLYAALGESTQSYYSQATTGMPPTINTFGVFNAVYRTENPDYISTFTSGPTWWLGTGTLEPLVPQDATISQTDRRPGDGFPIGPVVDPLDGTLPGRNGYIKIAAFTVAEEVGPYGITTSTAFDGLPRLSAFTLIQPAGAAYAQITIYASVTTREPNTNREVTVALRGELLDIQKSTNRGWTWAATGSTPVLPFGQAFQNNNPLFNVRPALGRYDHVLIVNDRDPRANGDGNVNEVTLGGLDYLFRTADGGTTWGQLNSDDRGFRPGEQFHALAYDTSDRLLVGSDAGLWRWDRFRFSNLNSNLPTTQLNSVDVNPTDFRQAVAGSSDNGTQQWNGNTADGSTGVWARVDDSSFTPTDGLSGSITGIVRYDPQNPTVLYAARDGFLRKSTDSGQTWVTINPAAAELQTAPNAGWTAGNSNPVHPQYPGVFPIFFAALNASNQFPLVVDPLTPNRVLVGGLTWDARPIPAAVTRLYESTDGGTNWTNINSGGLGVRPRVIALAGYQGAFVPDTRFPTVTEGLSNTPDPRTIYVSDGATIRVTKNRGNSWVGALGNIVVPAGGSITDIAVNPVNRDEVYATVSAPPGTAGGRIWRSLNAGQTWTNLTGTFDPSVSDPEQGPLPVIPTYKVVVDPRSGNLYVGNDNGVWQLVDPSATDPANIARTAGAGTLFWRRFGDGLANVSVRDMVLNQNSSTLTIGTYGRGVYQMFLPDYVANSGAVRAVSGSSRWTGPVVLTGNTRIGAAGTQQIQNGLSAASVDFGGTISSPGGAFTLEKTGRGTVILSGANTYTGQTLVQEGILEVKDPNALGAASPTGNTVVRYGAALQVRSDIEAEPITINGDGIYFNGHATGAIRNISGNNVYNGILTLGTGTFTAAPQPLDPSVTQVTIGVDSGTSLTIGRNPNRPNPYSPALDIVGHVQGATAAMGFDKELPGTLILTSQNAVSPADPLDPTQPAFDYAGITNVLVGAVEVRNALALGPVGSQPTRVTDGAAVRIANVAPSTPTIVTGEALFLSGTGTPDGTGGAGSGALRNTGGDNTWNGPITFTSIPGFAPTTNPGTQIAFGVTSDLDTLTVGPTAGIAEDSAVAQYGLIKVGAGAVRLTTANQYNGVTNVNEGTLRAANNLALGANTASSEVQTIRVFGTGSFRLNLNGQLTPAIAAGPLAAGATAATVAAALERLIAGDAAVVGTTQTNVQVTETPNADGRVYTVTFRGRLAGQNIALMTVANPTAGVTVSIDAPQEGGFGTVVKSGASLEVDGSGLDVEETLTINGPGFTDGVGNVFGALSNQGGDNTYSGTVSFGSASSIGARAGTTLTVDGRVLGLPNDPLVVPNPTTPAVAELTKVGFGTVVFPDDKEFRGRTVIARGALQIQSSGSLGVGRNEVQRVTVTGTFNTTQYTLTFLGETFGVTTPLTFRAGAVGASDLQTALEALPSIGAGNVTVALFSSTNRAAGDTSDEAIYTVTFGGALANTNVPLLTDASPSTPVSPAPITLPIATKVQGQPLPPSGPGGANEEQTVTIPNQAGTFTLNGNGPNPFDLTTGQFQTILDTLFGAGNTSLAVATQPGNNGRVFTITFINALGFTNILDMTGTFTPTATVRTQVIEDGEGSETQLVDVQGTSGQYRLSYTNPFTGLPVTGTMLLNFNAPATDPLNTPAVNAFEEALEFPVSAGGLGINDPANPFGYLGTGDVRVIRSNSQGGFQYLVQFRNALGNVNLLPITVIPTFGSAVTSVTATLQDGPEGTVVLAGAALQVLNLGSLNTMTRESVTLNGDGIGGTGALRMLDSTPNTIVWNAPVILGSTAAVGVDDATDTLRFTLATSDRNPYSAATTTLGPTNVRGNTQNFGLNKVGTGTLEYAASGNNDYTGVTTVKDGTLLLNYTAFGGNQAAIIGDGNPTTFDLVVGDGTGAANSAVARLARSNQITDSVTVSVKSDGLFDLNGFNETIASLTVVGGQTNTNLGGTGGNLTVTGAIIVGDPTGPTMGAAGGSIIVQNGGSLSGASTTMTGGTITVGTTAAATATLGPVVMTNAATITGATGATINTTTITASGGSTVTLTGPGGTLNATGAISLDASFLNVGPTATAQTNGNSITAVNNSVITTGNGAILTTVSGATRGAVLLTNSTLNAGPNSQTLTGTFTLNGTPGSAATFGTDSTLNTGGNALTLTNSTLTGTTGVDLLTGAVSLTDSTLSLGDGPSATLNTGGQNIDLLRSTLRTGTTGNPTVVAGNLTATGTAAARSTVDFGATTTANLGVVSLTQTDLDVGATASVSTTGAVSLTNSTADFAANSALTTAAGGLTLVNSTFNGSVGVDISTQALGLDASTLNLGNGPSATLNTNGAAITLQNASALSIGTGPGATLTGGNLTATGASTVATGDNSTATLGATSLTGGSLTTGMGSSLTTASLTGIGAAISLGANSTNTTGDLTTTTGPVTLGAGSTTTIGVLSVTDATVTQNANAAATATAVNLTGGHVALAGGATLSTAGTVTATSDNAVGGGTSDVTGAGTFQLTSATPQTVAVADGPQNQDFLISSQLTATTPHDLVKTGAGRLVLAPSGAGYLSPVVIQLGDVEVDTVTAAVQIAGGSLSGTGTVGSITGTSGAAVGTVAPGVNYAANPAGILTSTGPVTLGVNSVFSVNLAGNGISGVNPTAGTHYDQLLVNGNVVLGNGTPADRPTLAGLLNITDVRLGHRFTIIATTAGNTISGSFVDSATAPGFVFIDGYKFQIVYNHSPAGDSVVLEKVRVATMTTLASANSFNAMNGSPSTLNQPVTFTASVTAEPGSRVPPVGTTFVRFFVDGIARSPDVAIGIGGVATAVYTDIPDGIHTITAQYLGDADNFAISNSGSLTQVVETPAVTLTSSLPVPAPISPNNPSSDTVNDTLNLTAAVTNERSAYAYTVVIRDSSSAIVYQFTSPTVPAVAPANTSTIMTSWDGKTTAGAFVADGTYTAEITITDQWNNFATTGTVVVTVDNTSPTASGTAGAPVILPGNPTPPPPATTTLTGSVSDANLASFTVTVTDSANNPVWVFTNNSPASPTAPVNVTWDGTRNVGSGPVPDGTYTITLTATDLGGNTSTPVVNTVYILTTAPTVTVTSGLGTVVGPTVYGQAVTLTAVVSLPASVAGASSLLAGKPVNFSFPGTGTLTSNLVFNGSLNRYEAVVVVPQNLGAGSYTGITATFLPTNDFLGNVSGAITHVVTPAPLRVTGVNATKVYGDPNPAFTFTVTAADLKFSDTAAVVTGTPGTTATQASPVGNYPITQGTGVGSVSALPNYTVVFTNGTFTVTPAALTIQANDATKARFAPNPPFTATFTGFKNGDTPAVVSGLNLTSTATTTSPTGTYPIFSGTTPTAANYAITFNPGTLTVTGSPTATVIGAGGAPAQAKVLAADGAVATTIPFDPAFAGGIRTASADFNKDGVADYVIGTGPGRPAYFQVIDGATNTTLFQGFPFGDFAGGLFVAAGDVTGDGAAELVVTPDEGGGPRVIVYRGGDFGEIVSYLGIDDKDFRGGARAAVGDMNGDGFAEVVVSAGFGGGPRISVWDGKKLSNLEFTNVVPDFFVYEQALRNGAFVAVGDVDGDGRGDLIAGAGPGGGPRVKVYSGASLFSVGEASTKPMADFFAGNVNNRGGVKVAAKNLDGDKFIDVVSGGGLGDQAIATAYRGLALKAGATDAIYAVDLDGTLNGVFVG